MKSRAQITFEQKQKIRLFGNTFLTIFLIVDVILIYLTLTGFTTYPAPMRAESRLCIACSHVSTGYAEGTVNLRACPSVSCPSVAVLNEGDEILIAPGTGEDWLQVVSAQGQGWIYGQFVEVSP